MDVNILRALAFVSAAMAVMMALFMMYRRSKRRTEGLRLEITQQRKDALRSVRFMLKQMEYDAEVLRLLRHARTSKENGDDVAFNGALDQLIEKEREMMKRLDSAAEFEDYLKKTYSDKKSILSGGKRQKDTDGSGTATPDEMKSDIKTFIRDLEKIRGGEKRLLDEKVEFFSKWVEGPERAELLESLTAMERFLDAGDPKGLRDLADRKKDQKGRKKDRRGGGRESAGLEKKS